MVEGFKQNTTDMLNKSIILICYFSIFITIRLLRKYIENFLTDLLVS